MEQNHNTSLFQLNLDAQNSYTLRSAASWARVLGVVSLILGALFIIIGIIVQQTISRAYGSYAYRDTSMVAGLGMAVYLLSGLIQIIGGIFALNAGNKISTGLRNNDQPTLNAGFAAVRNFFSFWAILIIIGLLIVFISLVTSLSR